MSAYFYDAIIFCVNLLITTKFQILHLHIYTPLQIDCHGRGDYSASEWMVAERMGFVGRGYGSSLKEGAGQMNREGERPGLAQVVIIFWTRDKIKMLKNEVSEEWNVIFHLDLYFSCISFVLWFKINVLFSLNHTLFGSYFFT